uniref:lysosomal thioesterase PPT2-A-like isoform X1 n=2 Tax=Myxine glutinosa TaxID=7769 RepID=UPI00358E3AB4
MLRCCSTNRRDKTGLSDSTRSVRMVPGHGNFFLLSCLFLAVTLSISFSSVTPPIQPRPVVLIHGVLDGPKDLRSLRKVIEKAHPRTNVTIIAKYDYLYSLEPMWKQVAGFCDSIRPIVNSAPNGIHLICYSQGGLMCRAMLATWPDHKVHTFISLSAPQMGQYGDTSYLKWLFPGHVKTSLYRACYTSVGQDISVCNYWNDPHHQERYRASSRFLAMLNNQSYNQKSQEWKKNFLRVQRLVLIGGPDDGVITPWQSSHFGFYDSNETVEDFKNQEVYKNDSFGLRTLNLHGRLFVYSVSGVHHTKWHRNESVAYNYIIPWLD